MIIPNINHAQFEALVRQYYKEKAESDAHLQWKKTLPADVRGRMAVIDMAMQRQEWFARMGIEKRYEDCQRYMEDIARKAEKK